MPSIWQRDSKPHASGKPGAVHLTAEQVVESVHWHDKVNGIRTALKTELIENYKSAAERIIQTACLNSQLDTLKERVLTSSTTLKPAPTFYSSFGPSVYRHASRPWDDTIWQSALGEQVISRFDRAERQQLAAVYSNISFIRRMNNEEDAADGPLNALSVSLPLDPGLRGHFVELIEAARQRANFTSFIAGQIMDDERAVMPELGKVLRDPNWRKTLNQPYTTPSFCRAHGYRLGPIPNK